MGLETTFIQNGNTTTMVNADLIAHVSSELPSKERWTEFFWYITEHGEHVLQGVGRSRVEGEGQRFWHVISKEPSDCLAAVIGSDVSRLAKKLLAEVITSLSDWPEDAE